MKITLELPFPLPTWNRILAMHHWERKRLRDVLHSFVYYTIIGETPNSKELEYYGNIIRPKSSRKNTGGGRVPKVSKNKTKRRI